MDEQNGQIMSITGAKCEKKIRIGTGLGFRNSSQVQRNQSKNFIPVSDQNLSNGLGQPLTLQSQYSAPANNQIINQNSPSSNLISSQIQNSELAQNPQMTSSQGFFRRKINLKMSTTNLKAFLNKQPSDNNPLIIKSSKSRFIGSHLSQGNIQAQNQNINIQGSLQQQGNYFSSQKSLQNPSISNSSNNHSPSAYNSIMNSINSDHNSIFQNGINSGKGNNSNIDSFRSINSNDQITSQTHSAAKQGENVSIFNRGMRLSRQSSKNSSILKQNTNEKFKKKIINEESNFQDNQDLEENNEDQNSLRNNSMTKNTISNYSHNTESTNITAQISHHNYGNQSIQNNYSDHDKIKNKQISSHPSAYISQTSSQTNIPTIYVKKKINEAKQYSNQVRQQIFVKQDQEEEENFLELCETLNKINYN